MKKESEKTLERKLGKEVKLVGGLSIKVAVPYFTGLPDRMCLLPRGCIFFVEVKSTGIKPTKLQLSVHKKLRKLGFTVYILDNSEYLKTIIEYEKVRSKS